MGVQDLTWQAIVGAVLVLLLVADIYIKLTTAARMAREEKKRKDAPVNTLENTVNDHTRKLENDHTRLTDLEDSNRIIMRALLAMLSHEINGNSDAELRASFAEIQKYLIER